MIGESGSGKTTLLNRYQSSGDALWKTCRIRTQSADGRRPALPLKNLDNYPAYILQDADARDPIIMIDDAHTFSRTDIEFLLRDALTPDRSSKVKRLVLFGEPGLVAKFSALSESVTGETAVNKIFLPSITQEETAAYLRHRLAVAGYASKSPFNSSVVKRLHRKSSGLPGRINAKTRQWLENNYGNKKSRRSILQTVSGRFIRLVVWTAVGCLIAIPAMFLFFKEDSPPPKQRRHKTMPDRVIRVKIPTESKDLKPRSDIVSPRPVTRQKPNLLPDGTGSDHKPVKTGPIKAAPSLIVTASDSAKEKISTKKIYRENWLSSQSPSHFTVQLMGVRKEQSLLKFVAHNQSLTQHRIAYYRTTYRGKEWFPLLCGVYSTKKEARSAIKDLPENIRKLSPWIRRLSSVQNDIKRQKKP